MNMANMFPRCWLGSKHLQPLPLKNFIDFHLYSGFLYYQCLILDSICLPKLHFHNHFFMLKCSFFWHSSTRSSHKLDWRKGTKNCENKNTEKWNSKHGVWSTNEPINSWNVAERDVPQFRFMVVLKLCCGRHIYLLSSKAIGKCAIFLFSC